MVENKTEEKRNAVHVDFDDEAYTELGSWAELEHRTIKAQVEKLVLDALLTRSYADKVVKVKESPPKKIKVT